jgi:hypothetical protein
MTATHTFGAKVAHRNNANGYPVMVGSCSCGWEHMTAFNPSEGESERKAKDYLLYRHDQDQDEMRTRVRNWGGTHE